MHSEDKNISPEFLVGIVKSLMIAGRDTTACTLSWMFYLLAKHPDVQDILIQEIDETFRGEEPNMKDVGKMKYLDSIVMETLRMYPPVPIDVKYSLNDDYLPDNTFIPKNTPITYYPFVMGRLERFWDRPDEFLPERWSNRRRPSPYEFPVFQAGPRICLGQSLAFLETKILTCMLLQKFRFKLSNPDKPVHYTMSATMSIKDGLHIIPDLRE